MPLINKSNHLAIQGNPPEKARSILSKSLSGLGHWGKNTVDVARLPPGGHILQLAGRGDGFDA